MAERVRITDVSPRDGLQNEPGFIPTADKVRLIELLARTGVDEIEVTSFVSPKWVPQLADAGQLCVALARRGVRRHEHSPGSLSALVPNLKGLESLESINREATSVEQELGAQSPDPLINKICLMTAASETFSQKNTRASIAESLVKARKIVGAARCPFRIRAYISCAIAFPFEGPIPATRVADLVAQLVGIGNPEIDLGDTIGAATAETTARLLQVVKDRIGEGWFERGALTLHLHDTFSLAAECVKAALDLGVRSFDGSVAGLGGCPYASTPGKRAPGNIDTAVLIRTIHDAGYETGVDLERLAEAGAFARQIVARARTGAGT